MQERRAERRENMLKRKKAILFWVLLVLWAGVIFFFSAQPDTVSSQQSGLFTQILEEAVIRISGSVKEGKALYAQLDHLVRKSAHFMVYFILGALAQRACWHSAKQKRPMRVLAVAVAACALYAVSDEIHQYFVPGRSMMISDMLLDSVGALCGAGAATFFLNVARK